MSIVTAITADGKQRVELTTRVSVNGAHSPVVDLLRFDRLALVVCLNCGATWPEGGETGKACR